MPTSSEGFFNLGLLQREMGGASGVPMLTIDQCVRFCALFDGDGSGSVAHSEFTEGLRRFGISMTEEEMTILVEELDHDRDGSISLQEFTHLLKSVHEREHDVAQLH